MRRQGPSGTWPGRLYVTTFCLIASLAVVGCAGGGKSNGDSVDPQQADAERKAAEDAMRGGYTPKNLRPEKSKAKTKTKVKGKSSPQAPAEPPAPEPASTPPKAG